MGLCTFVQSAYSAITIDNFNAHVFCNIVLPCAQPTPTAGNRRVDAPNVGLGGERDHIFYAYPDNLFPIITSTRMPGFNTAMIFNVANGIDSSLMSLVYDGNDNNDVDTIVFNLMNVDLTNGGAENAFRLRISTATDVSLRLKLYEDVDTYSEISKTVPSSNNVYQNAYIPFLDPDFVHVNGGVDLASVKAIELEFINEASSEGDALTIADAVVALLGNNAASLAFGVAICNAVPANCLELHHGIGIDHFETTKQISHTISAAILDDKNLDGDIDSAADLEDTDTFRYTVTITNADDLLDAPATNLVYTASFNPDYASFISGTVTSGLGSVTTGNEEGHTSIMVEIGTLADGESVTITYDMKVDAGYEQTPNITYSHHGNISADEWDAYDTDSINVLINKFDFQTDMTVAALDDADGDGFSGAGERIRYTVTINNVGPNTSSLVVFDLPALDGATFVTNSYSHVSGVSGTNQSANGAVRIRYTNFPPYSSSTFTFDFKIMDEPIYFAEIDRITASALITNDAGAGQPFYIGLSDDPTDPTSGFDDPTVILIDAFPNNVAASVDGDDDGMPDEWNAGCNAACQQDSGLTLDPSPNDTDNNGVPNDPDNPNADDDGDGVPNGVDAFPFDPAASVDTDGDGMPDAWNAGCDAACQQKSSLTVDDDDDNDGVPDVDDAFPLHCQASVDTDGDGKPDSFHNPLPAGCVNDGSLLVDDDDDNDGVLDVNDAFPLNPAASVDADGDGMPDAWNAGCNLVCQQNSGLTLDAFPNDTDNDGVINALDAFPTKCQASVDTDGDGKPDSFHDPLPAGCVNDGSLIEDDDDDNDGVLDVDDAFPLNPAASVDTDGDGMPDEWNAGCDVSCQQNSGLTLDPYPNDTDNNGVPNDPDNPDADDDGDGIPNSEDDEPYRDNNPPTIVAPKAIQINSTGKLTTLPGNLLKNAVASDVYQGVAVACERILKSTSSAQPCWYFHDAKTTYAVGEHVITWTVVDTAGNSSTDTQKLTVVGKDSGGDGGNNSGSAGGGGGGSLSAYGVFVLLALLWRRRQLVAM